jgi:hypothetical protein
MILHLFQEKLVNQKQGVALVKPRKQAQGGQILHVSLSALIHRVVYYSEIWHSLVCS